MSWQSSHTVADRLFGSLVYLLPIAEVYGFGSLVSAQFPILEQLYQPLLPLMLIHSIPYGGFILFLVLYLAVVKNPKVSRFIQFNTLQAILIGIAISLCGIFINYILLPIFLPAVVTQVLSTVVFVVTIAIAGYAIVMSALGKYTDVPKLSEAAQMTLDRY
jgi:drug/metabolite transporter (DMT)-like permease